MRQTYYTITLDLLTGLILDEACKAAASWMSQDLAEDEKARRSFKVRFLGHTHVPRKDLSQFPRAIAEYYAVRKMLCEMGHKGTIRINEATANLLMMPLTITRMRIEASPDCREKTEQLAVFATIMGQLPVKEGKTADGIVYWGDVN